MAQKKRTRRQSLMEDLAEIDQMYEAKRNQIMSLQFSINCKFKNTRQKEMYNTIMSNRITFVRGAAGTGKTIISLLTALKCVKDSNVNIDQIILTKPIVEITSTKGLGALPGDINEKTLSYYTHFYDNLIKLIGNEATKYLKNNEVIKETVLNYLRGSTFGRWDSNGNPIGSFCIFDEAQNCSIVEMKTFISRMGEESKLVIMGDSDQVDLKLNKGEKCGLDDAWDRLQGIDGIGFVEFTEDDIVRDPFLIEIMKRYKNN
jgi:phosphate starvation-inducible protein PhoH and related proteins